MIMNKRINELAIKAGLTITNLKDDEKIKEFAKIITVECASMCYADNFEDLECPEPIVVNKDCPNDLAIGDYVFASKFSDCDPGDPWNVGHVSEIGIDYVICGDVSQRRWSKAMKITKEQGTRICVGYPILEKTNSINYVTIAEVFGMVNY